MNEQPTIDQLAEMSKLCALIGSVADSNFEFQAFLYRYIESFYELSETASCFSDLSLSEFVKVLNKTIEQFNALQQDSISVPALNPVEGQPDFICLYDGNPCEKECDEWNSLGCWCGYTHFPENIQLSTKSGDN